MPKPKAETVLAKTDKWTTVEIETAAGGEDKGTTKTQYSRPTLDVMRELLLDDSKLDITVFYPQYKNKAEDTETVSQFIHRLFLTALDRKARADAYESLAQESTYITVGTEKANIMDFPLIRLVRGINGMRQQ